jgi:hypothetical protein
MENALQPPANPFEVFIPNPDQPWDRRAVGHLLRRTGFGARADRIEATLALSPQAAVAGLTGYDPATDPLGEMFEQLQGFLTPFRGDEKSATNAQAWWVFRMLYTERPLQEKIALFWHNRFATSATKVGEALMDRQVDLFRRQGLGNFRDLLLSVGRDPAMILWLDGQTNRKGHPNENYAREVLELFALGPGNYSEKDIQELARAFTGWRVKQGVATLDRGSHDEGDKAAFGRSANFDDRRAVDWILEQPAAPRFIARQLLKEFVHPDPLPEHLDHYANRQHAHKWEINPVLTEILTSRLFFSPWAYRSRIKSPIELTVGAAIALGGKPAVVFLRDAAVKMGQSILYPPGVKGWDGHTAWVNSNTVLCRANFALAMATQHGNEFVRKSDVEGWLVRQGIVKPADIVDRCVGLLLDGQVPPEVRDRMTALFEGVGGKRAVLSPGTPDPKVRALLHVILSTPEYQLA